MGCESELFFQYTDAAHDTECRAAYGFRRRLAAVEQNVRQGRRAGTMECGFPTPHGGIAVERLERFV